MFKSPAPGRDRWVDAGFRCRLQPLLRAAVFVNRLPNSGRNKGVARKRVRLGFDGLRTCHIQIVKNYLSIRTQMAKHVCEFMQQREPKIVQSVVTQSERNHRNTIAAAHRCSIKECPWQMFQNDQYDSHTM